VDDRVDVAHRTRRLTQNRLRPHAPANIRGGERCPDCGSGENPHICSPIRWLTFKLYPDGFFDFDRENQTRQRSDTFDPACLERQPLDTEHILDWNNGTHWNGGVGDFNTAALAASCGSESRPSAR
jgi:hypothetical protein